MKIEFLNTSRIADNQSVIYVTDKKTKLDDLGLNKSEKSYIEARKKAGESQISINQYSRWIHILVVEKGKNEDYLLEDLRKAGNSFQKELVSRKLTSVSIVDCLNKPEYVLAMAEGIALSNYQFLKYFRNSKERKNSLELIRIYGESLKPSQPEQLLNIIEGVYHARTLVNEPLSELTAVRFSEEIQKLGKEAGFEVEVLHKKKIEALKMGGLLAVNKGSIDPPTFTILEWKPRQYQNKKPLVLIGKGVVYDTGGLSLKPTKDSMDFMKSDMAGAAAIVGAIYAIAKSGLPVHVIGLVPATDNRPDGNAYVPGDVVVMGNGMTVEVLNTDAEGRMILAEALHYAENYKPGLIIDVATLTGAAAMAVGKYGIVGMGNATAKQFESLQRSGEKVSERVVEFPFWDDYNHLLKSNIADLKNIGGKDAGAITAGKFLEHFTNYPYIHLDIAGSAYVHKEYGYRGKGGTGYGVRLLFDFVKHYSWK